MPNLNQTVSNALDSLKAQDLSILNVEDLTCMTDYMIFATGTSKTHVGAMADAVIKAVKAHNVIPMGIEGEKEQEWLLIDLGDVVVHIMLREVRDFYQVEKLWTKMPMAAVATA